MDALTPVGRRFAGPPASMGVGSGEYHDHGHPPAPLQNQQQGQFWYPPPPSSAAPGEAQHPFSHNLQQQHHPPPPMFSGPFPPHPPPPYPHHQQQLRPPPWVPPSDHLQQFHQPSSFPPGVSPPLGVHFSGPPHPGVGSPLHHGAPPPNPPYPTAHHNYPPPHPAQSHPPHAQPPPPPLPPQSVALPQAYPQANQMWGNSSWHGAQGWNYTDANFQYNNGEDWGARARAWAASANPAQFSSFGSSNNIYRGIPSFSSDSQHPTVSTLEEHLPGSRADLPSRANNLPGTPHESIIFDAGDGSTAAERSADISLPQRSFTSPTSVTVQEVSSSYSSSSGGKEATDTSQKLLMVDQTQAIEQIPFDRGQIPSTFSTDVEQQARPMRQSRPSPSPPLHVPVFPLITPVPPGPQFEPPSIPQVFGRIQQPSFQPLFGPPHPTATFPVDNVETFNLPERPKKAAVPNWLRDEIIKKKVSIVGSTPEHSNGNSQSSLALVREKDPQNGEPFDVKHIESPLSSEEEEDDEEDADAVRSAAINQEIKRVLTDVLLKVTEELFEEIATKVLDEDQREDPNVVVAKQKDEAATVVLMSTSSVAKSDGADQLRSSNSGGAILGLADYSSSSSSSDHDDDNDESVEIRGSNMTSSGNVPGTSEQHETAGPSLVRENKREKGGPSTASEEPIEVSSGLEGSSKGVPSVSNGMIASHTEEHMSWFTDPGRAAKSDRKDLLRGKLLVESNNGKSKTSDDDPADTRAPSHKNVIKKSNREDSVSGVLKTKTSQDLFQQRGNEQAILKRGLRDQSSRQAIFHDNDGDDGRRREKAKDEREDRSRQATKDVHKKKNRRTSPSSASSSGDEGMESSRKRKLQSRRQSLSPSPSRPRRQVLRSPHSKHSQRRHSPYSHLDSRRRSRSRSSSPRHRRRSGHRR